MRDTQRHAEDYGRTKVFKHSICYVLEIDRVRLNWTQDHICSGTSNGI